MRYLIKVTVIWISILAVLVFFAFLSSWNVILIGVITGAAVGFLPAFFLNTLAEARRWHLKDIEDIYAPLKSEIDDLAIYFSEAIKGDYSGDLFGYGKDRSRLLSMEVWLRVIQDNLYYRLRLDDKDLAQKILSIYQFLGFYIKNRTEFISTLLDPIFLAIKRDLSDPKMQRKLERIQIEVRNIVLDACLPNRDVMLGFYRFTKLPSDYREIADEANIPEKSLQDFVVRVLETLRGELYDLLLEQRGHLLRDVAEVKAKLEEKLEEARPA